MEQWELFVSRGVVIRYVNIGKGFQLGWVEKCSSYSKNKIYRDDPIINNFIVHISILLV